MFFYMTSYNHPLTLTLRTINHICFAQDIAVLTIQKEQYHKILFSQS